MCNSKEMVYRSQIDPWPQPPKFAKPMTRECQGPDSHPPLKASAFQLLIQYLVSFGGIFPVFPDDRHDDWRHIPGLFSKLSNNVPEIVLFKRNDISLCVPWS